MASTAVAAPATTTTTSTQGKKPSDLLKQMIGRPVIVKLSSGITYQGVLACLDSCLNIGMEQTEEYVDGHRTKLYGDAFIRGNNVLYIGPLKRK